eukprot:TRINITY_DN3369_c0_g1_i1.p1 TRINITY_DN3369_c0_g1~~TRINITY_DN3369_c0_g1_i1.p1  ORF type:complete len:362 (-),score=77.98 TRINITY_DN3369_c0_g1_i1:95-1180(-)
MFRWGGLLRCHVPAPPRRNAALIERPATHVAEHARRSEATLFSLSPAVSQCLDVEIEDTRTAIWRAFLRGDKFVDATSDERVWTQQQDEFQKVRDKWMHVQKCLESKDPAIRAIAEKKINKTLSRNETQRTDTEAFLDELETSLPAEFRAYFREMKASGLSSEVRDVDWEVLENYMPDGTPATKEAEAKTQEVILAAQNKQTGKRRVKPPKKAKRGEPPVPIADGTMTMESAGDLLAQLMNEELQAMRSEKRLEFASAAQQLRGSEALTISEIERCKSLLEWEMKEDKEFLRELSAATGVDPEAFISDLTRHLQQHVVQPGCSIEEERNKSAEQRFTEMLERDREATSAALANLRQTGPID